MKKTLIYLAAAVLVVSCAKNEAATDVNKPLDSSVIGFNASTGKVSRANDNTAAGLQAGIEVMALKSDKSSLFTKPAAGTSSIYKWVTDKWAWADETDDKKWPKVATDYPLTFMVAFPAIADVDFGPFAGTPKYTNDIAIDNTSLAANEDLLAALAVENQKPVSGVTTLNFKHILSNIQFKVLAPKDYKVYIQSLTIKNVAKAGRSYDYSKTYDLAYSPESTYAAAQLTDYVHMQGDATQQVVTITGLGYATPATESVALLSGNGTAGNTDTWKLMPQKNVVAWDKAAYAAAAAGKTAEEWAAYILAHPEVLEGARIELVYRMEDASGKSIIGWKANEKDPANSLPATNSYVTVAFPLDIAKVGTDKGWEPAKRYTYQISLGTPDSSNGTLVDPEFKDEAGTETDKPVDNPSVKPGEDITDTEGYIGFDVIIDAWGDSTQEIK